MIVQMVEYYHQSLTESDDTQGILQERLAYQLIEYTLPRQSGTRRRRTDFVPNAERR